MKSVYINNIATYLPETAVTNKEIIGNGSGWDEEKVFAKLGIRERRVARRDQYSSDLGVKAVERLMEKTSLSDIDFILYCTQSPDYLIPSNAFLLHNHFGFSKDVGALDFNLGCSGYIYGLSLAKGLICSGQANKILLVTSETYTKHLSDNDISNQLIFGDGASATLISNIPDGHALCLESFKFGTDGSGWDKLKSGVGGIRQQSEADEEQFLKMNGQEVLLFTLREIPRLVRELLAVNELNTVDHFIFHQANKFVLDQIVKKMSLNSDIVRNHLEFSANTVSATIPIVLEEQMEKSVIKCGDVAALIGFGVGFSWAGVVLTKK